MAAEPLTALVTGGAGRIGRQVVDALHRSGHRATSFDLKDARRLGDVNDLVVFQSNVVGTFNALEAAAITAKSGVSLRRSRSPQRLSTYSCPALPPIIVSTSSVGMWLHLVAIRPARRWWSLHASDLLFLKALQRSYARSPLPGRNASAANLSKAPVASKRSKISGLNAWIGYPVQWLR
jgi:hypothetical protein